MYCPGCNLKTPPTLSRCPQCQGWLKPSIPQGAHPRTYQPSSLKTEDDDLPAGQPTGHPPEPIESKKSGGDLSDWQPTGRSNYRPAGPRPSEQPTRQQATAAPTRPNGSLPVTWLALAIITTVAILGLILAPPPSSGALPEGLPSQAVAIGKAPPAPTPTDGVPADRHLQQGRIRGAWLVDRAVRLYSTGDYLPASEAASQALEVYQESDSTAEQLAAAHFWLGVSEARLENLDEARRHLAEAAHLQPQNTKYQRTLDQFDAHAP